MTDTVHDIIDICFNFTHSSFRNDEKITLQRAVLCGVSQMMVTGSNLEDSHEAIRLSERFKPTLFATAGIHPHHANTWLDDSQAALRHLAQHPRVKAIGETGLDYHRNFSSPEEQRLAFSKQLELAVELKLPAFLHERDAHGDFLAILQDFRPDLSNVVVHCFTGNEASLLAYIEHDCHIGITGWICDERRGQHLIDIIQHIPANRLMIETDAPYLLPRDLEHKPSNRRNEPMYLPHILQAVATILQKPAAQVAAETTQNARRFYALPPP